MIKNILTYITMLAIVLLPMRLLNASVEMNSMQMSMNINHQLMMMNDECQHEVMSKDLNLNAEQRINLKSCCDDLSNSCCNDVHQAASALVFSSLALPKLSTLSRSGLFSKCSLSQGITQNNLLRPPRKVV